MLVRDIMRTRVVSVSPDTGVSELAELMLREHVSTVPVVDDGVLVGIVNEDELMHRHEIGTERDPASRPWWLRLFAGERCPATYVESHAAKVVDIMDTRVVSVSDDAPIARVVDLLDTRGIRRVPVVRADKLVGTIGRPDLVRALVASARNPDAEPPMDDELIHRALRSELESQPWWHPTQSRFTVQAGVVHFHGLVESAEEARAARVAAENLPGVGDVVDHRLDASGMRWGWW
jgi:CBS domain-containing protein